VNENVAFLACMGLGKLLLEPLPDGRIARYRFVEVNVNPGVFGKAVRAVIPLGAYQGINIAPL